MNSTLCNTYQGTSLYFSATKYTAVVHQQCITHCTTKQQLCALTASYTAPSWSQWLYLDVDALLKKIEKLAGGERGRGRRSRRKGLETGEGGDEEEKEWR